MSKRCPIIEKETISHTNECYWNASKIEFDLPYVLAADIRLKHHSEITREEALLRTNFLKMVDDKITERQDAGKRIRTVTEVGCICKGKKLDE